MQVWISEQEAVKVNAIRLAEHHRKTCNVSTCNVSLYHLLRLLQMAGIELTKEEREAFL